MSADWAKDIVFCTTCRMFSMPVLEIPSDMCAKCGEMTGIRIATFQPSQPIPIPPRNRPPPRLESPRLTPNMAPAAFPASFTSNLGSHILVFRHRSIDDDNVSTRGEEEEDPSVELAVQESLADAPSPEPRPADPELLNAMHKFKYIPLGETPTSCAICMDDFSPGDELVKTRCCGGITHHGCMDSTLCVIPSCPFCRSSKLSSSAPPSSSALSNVGTSSFDS